MMITQTHKFCILHTRLARSIYMRRVLCIVYFRLPREAQKIAFPNILFNLARSILISMNETVKLQAFFFVKFIIGLVSVKKCANIILLFYFLIKKKLFKALPVSPLFTLVLRIYHIFKRPLAHIFLNNFYYIIAGKAIRLYYHTLERVYQTKQSLSQKNKFFLLLNWII